MILLQMRLADLGCLGSFHLTKDRADPLLVGLPSVVIFLF